MNKPKILYRFNSYNSGEKKIEKHKITSKCCPQIEIQSENNFRGPLWRCRNEDHDFYGYDNRLDAKYEEIQNTRQRLYADQEWLKKLTKNK